MIQTERDIQTQFPSPGPELPQNHLETGESQTLKNKIIKFSAESMFRCPWVPDPPVMSAGHQAPSPPFFAPFQPHSPLLPAIAGSVHTLVSYSPKEMCSEHDLLLDLSCKKIFEFPPLFCADQ